MQIFSSKGEGKEENKEKSRTDQAKELLAKYGGAYLATSITLSLISFSLCYLLVSAGIDVQALLQKVCHMWEGMYQLVLLSGLLSSVDTELQIQGHESQFILSLMMIGLESSMDSNEIPIQFVKKNSYLLKMLLLV